MKFGAVYPQKKSVKENRKKTILFICGCLEKGKDGVGDYTRLLACNLLNKHHVNTNIVALNDKYVSNHTSILEQQENIEVLRLNANQTCKSRYIILAQYINKITPDLISIQFVPYAFHKKGIPYQFFYHLSKLNVKKWHIMFHELWIGMEKKDSYQFKLIGFIQRQIIKALIKKLKPIQIHTSNNLYLRYLSSLTKKQAIAVLPLFSNIANFNSSPPPIVSSKSTFSIVLFGSIHHNAPIEHFIKWIKKELLLIKLTPIFIFVGNTGEYVNEWITILEQFHIKYQILSFQPESKIAEVLQYAQLGVTTTPYYLVDKSGTVAAMVQLNLPVLCVARTWTPDLKPNLLKQIVSDNCIKWDYSLRLSEVFDYKRLSHSIDEIGNTFLMSIN